MAETFGTFITLEGGEGSGKSSASRVLADRLREQGFRVCLTREPGDTSWGRMLQRILEQGDHDEPLTPLAELFLFEADRAQHVHDKIVPALAAGDVVICDRFADSTLAYQGFGRGLDLDFIGRLNDAATGALKPHLTLLLDVPPEVGLARASAQKDATGRESIAFHVRVREGFLTLAGREPDRFVLIDAARPLDDVVHQVIVAVNRLLEFQASDQPTHARQDTSL